MLISDCLVQAMSFTLCCEVRFLYFAETENPEGVAASLHSLFPACQDIFQTFPFHIIFIPKRLSQCDDLFVWQVFE